MANFDMETPIFGENKETTVHFHLVAYMDRRSRTKYD